LLVIVGGGSGVQGINTKMAKLQVFDRIPEKVSEFVTVCELYLRMK